ncbi:MULTISPECIES: tetratricopeptide repeat protein [Pseudomonas]|uniref:Tetratricopeptide repeat protein n=1 Tax=Pseudomonas quercus TaxID=2722792 RepID=A0ABX0Y8I9_9PSED|nr:MULTISPECIES: tetratricopeptide repeat protein [Pseudomonas]MBF7141088.1 tetratricopeptide repeat protein [Pseudomonas sp. LY10J]NJO99622.1 tetratricopeptide repeat protein [Pseudomonas quercus]
MTRVTRFLIAACSAMVIGLGFWHASTPAPVSLPAATEHGYASALHAARAGAPGAARLLYQQLDRADLTPSGQAALFAVLPDYPSPRALRFARAGLQASSPVVRRAAVQAVAGLLPVAEQAQVLGPLLDDADEGVRQAAAMKLLSLGIPQSGAYGDRLDLVLEGYARDLENQASDPAAQLQLATLRLQQGKPALAQSCAHAVLALQPDNLQARVILAKALDRLGSPDEARETLAEPLREQPDNAFLQHELGLWLLSHDQPAYALLALAKSVERAPQNATYRLDLALSLHRLDQPEAAQAQLDQLVRRHPANRKARVLLIEYWKQAGQLQNVQVLLAELEQQNPDDPLLDQGL